LALTPPFFAAFLRHRDANCAAVGAAFGACDLVFMRTFSLSRAFRTVVTQLPPRLACAPELARAALTCACSLAAFAADGALTPRNAARCVSHAAGGALWTIALAALHHQPLLFSEAHLPPWLDVLPARLRPLREAFLRRLAALLARLPPPALDYSALTGLNTLGVSLAAASAGAGQHAFGTLAASGRIALRVYGTLSLTALASSALLGGGAAQLGALSRRLGRDAATTVLEEVRLAAHAPVSEEAALRDVLAVLLRGLFPAARAAVVRLEPPHGHGRARRVAVTAPGCAAAAAAYDSDGDDDGSSRAFVAAQEQVMIADSRDFPDGVASFSDWARAAARAGNGAHPVLIAAPLAAGPIKLGSLVIHFGSGGDVGDAPALPPLEYEATLMRCCRAIGEGLFARREVATSHAASAVASDIFPAHVVAKLLERSRRASNGRLAVPSRGNSGSGRELGAGATVLPARHDAGGAERAAAASASPTRRRRERISSGGSAAGSAGGDAGGSADPAADALRATRASRTSITLPHTSAPTHEDGASDDEDDLFFHEQHACISIIFIDVVDFTPLAESQPPAATMRQLHGLFRRFDALCGVLDVYKIETSALRGRAACCIACVRALTHASSRVTQLAMRISRLRGCCRAARTRSTPPPRCSSRCARTPPPRRWGCACAAACTAGPSPPAWSAPCARASASSATW
jgi:hypothetical protein